LKKRPGYFWEKAKTWKKLLQRKRGKKGKHNKRKHTEDLGKTRAGKGLNVRRRKAGKEGICQRNLMSRNRGSVVKRQEKKDGGRKKRATSGGKKS